MNLWRVAIDENSGKVAGEPQRVTTPAAYAHHATFSKDGRMAYVSTTIAEELQRVPFDAAAEQVKGAPEPLVRDVPRLEFPHFSPDGEWLVYSQTEPQEDLLLSRADGSERRLLTNDPYRDRRPRFSPDGEQIAFYSNRGGHYEIWTIGRDGSGLRQLTRDPQRRTARYPVWGPDGSRLLFSRPGITGLIVATTGDLDAPPLDSLPPPSDDNRFVPLGWSPDGLLVAGMRVSASGERAGITTYDLKQDRYQDLVAFGTWPEWLKDGRRIVFQGPSPGDDGRGRGYPRGESAFLVDRVTRKVKELLTIPEVTVADPIISPDGAWLVFIRTTVKADVWTFTRDEPKVSPLP